MSARAASAAGARGVLLGQPGGLLGAGEGLVRRSVPGRPHRPDRHRSNCMARRPGSSDAIFWRIQGEVPSSPGTVAPGHDGVCQRSAGPRR